MTAAETATERPGRIADMLVAAAPPAPANSPAESATRPARLVHLTAWVGVRVADWGRTVWGDIRSSWWAPTSLPNMERAWRERMPDRSRVPGDNAALYWGWVAYNHTIGLAVPTAATAIVGVLTPLVWMARHPARLALGLTIGVPLAAMWIPAFAALLKTVGGRHVPLADQTPDTDSRQ